MKNIKERIIKMYEEKGEYGISSPIVDSYSLGATSAPWRWGRDCFVEIALNPGGNKTFIHVGRRVWKRVGRKWILHDTHYKLLCKEVNSKRELEFILNSKMVTEFINSVNWE